MKNLFSIYLLVFFFSSACSSQPAPIQSMKDIQPFLEKHLGTPTEIDTTFASKEDHELYTSLDFYYKNRNDLNIEKISRVLSEGFGEPVYRKDKNPESRSGGLIPLEKGMYGVLYKVQFGKFGKEEHPANYIICILDEKKEIPIPEKSGF